MNKIRKLSENSLDVFKESITAVQTHDFEKGEKVAEKVEKIIEEEKQIMANVSKSDENSTIIRFVLEDIRRISEYASDIAEIVLNMNIEKTLKKTV